MTAQIIQLNARNHRRLHTSAGESVKSNRPVLSHVLQDLDLLPTGCKKERRYCEDYNKMGLDGCHNCPLYGGKNDAV